MKKVLKWLLLLPLVYLALIPVVILLDATMPYRLQELAHVDIQSNEFDFGGLQENQWTVIGILNGPIPDSWKQTELSEDSEHYYHFTLFQQKHPHIKPEDTQGFILPEHSSLHAVILLHTPSRQVYTHMWR